MTATPAAGSAATPGAALSVRALGDDAAAQWDDFVAASPAASLYHRYAWRGLLGRVFDRESHYLGAFAGQRLVGVLPLVRLRSRLFGDFLVSMPYLNYGGVLGATPDASRALIEAACELGRGLGVAHVELRHRTADVALPARADKVAMLRQLPNSGAQLWQDLGSKLRAQVNQARKAGATCASGGLELVGEFYQVFAENMRDLGTPVYPRRFFEAIATTFPAATTLLVVRLDGRPVAAGFLLDDGRTVEIPWASSLRRAKRASVNMLLYWHALELAVERGRTTFDFGRSSPDSGTFAFKKQWGAKPRQLYWHYWLRDGIELPRLNPTNPKYALAIAMWRRLPLWLANRLGPPLVKHLP